MAGMSIRSHWRERSALWLATRTVGWRAQSERWRFRLRIWRVQAEAPFRRLNRKAFNGLIAHAGTMGDGAARRGPLRLGARAVYPFALWGLPSLLVANGAWTAGVAAAAGSLFLVLGPRLPVPRRAGECVGATAFLVALAVGAPRAVYTIGTEACVSDASDRFTGDVRSVDDPRLAAADRRWIARAASYLALGWPDQDGPAPDEAALANIVVNAPVVISEIRWRGPNWPLTRLGLWEAKGAYAAHRFDRRRVCQLFHTGDAGGRSAASDEAHAIVTRTEQELALILPALQATYLPPGGERTVADAGEPALAN